MAPFALSPGLDRFGLTRFKGGRVRFDPDAENLFSRYMAEPSAARKRIVSDLYVSAKDHGFYGVFDALYLIGAGLDDPGYSTAHDAHASRRNIIADQYNLSAVNSPVHVTDRGYAGNASSSYLNTNFNPTTAALPKFQRDTHHIFVRVQNNRTAAALKTAIGVRASGTNFFDLNPHAIEQAQPAGPLFRPGTSALLTHVVRVDGTGSKGHWLANRSSSNAIQGYRDGALIGSQVASASSVLLNGAIYLLVQNVIGASLTGYSDDQLFVASLGGSMTAEQAASFATVINDYASAVGA